MTENNFPTGKPHISFSEVKIWKECSWRHKLMYVDKVDTFKPSPYLDFGTAVHEGCETLLETRKVEKKKAKPKAKAIKKKVKKKAKKDVYF